MNLKKFIGVIFDPEFGRQERLFRLMISIGLLGLLIAAVSGILLGESLASTVVIFSSFFVLWLISWISIHFHHIQGGAVLIGFIIVFFVLPYNFLTTGGIDGGAPLWFLFGTFYTCLVIENKIKYFFLASSVVSFGVCYYLAYFYPELLIPHSHELAFMDSFLSLIIVSVLNCGMILFQNVIYRSGNELVKKQKTEIEKLNRAQNRFFSNLSHEIRTPINTILGLNEIILRENVSDEIISDSLKIQNAGKMLLSLINDVLDVSKIQSGKMEIVPAEYDVGNMLSDIVNMIWISAKQKGLEFKINVDQKIPLRLIGDEMRIKQILVNILNNAVKYTPEGYVALSIQCSGLSDGSVQMMYSVTDTGMGIKKENLPYLFNAFKRVDEEKTRYIEGTGLGLSIVRQLLDLMGGDVSVNSVYTKGSTFLVTIPQKRVDDKEIGKLDLETRHSINNRKQYAHSFEAPSARVLIVDDDEVNLLVEKKLLRDTKMQIDTVSGGAECLQKTQYVRYDVILMDHLMPEMDGIECLHHIRAQNGGLNRETPVVVLTANAGSENSLLYTQEGFDGILTKPVSGARLEAGVRDCLPPDKIRNVGTDGSVGIMEAPVLSYRKKIPVVITTESVCDLPKSLLEKYHIAVIPHKVITEAGVFLDGQELDSDGLISYINGGGGMVWTDAPSLEDLSSFFAGQLTKAQHVIHITLAKRVPPYAYAKAVEAAKIFENVSIVDSGHLSSGMGLMVLKAAQDASAGVPVAQILKHCDSLRPRIRTSFVVDSTDFLVRNAQISARANKLCDAFMLHPVLAMKKSAIRVSGIKVGTRLYVLRKYVRSALRVTGEIDRSLLFITYVGLSGDDLQEIKSLVAKIVDFEQVICQKSCPSISANCGPGTFGLLFLMKEN